MKKTLPLAALMVLPVILSAQTVAVKFYGQGNQSGLPEFWPQFVQPIPNATNAPSGFAVMNQLQLDQIISTNQPAYNAWKSNSDYASKAKLDLKMSEINAIYQLIPTGMTICTNDMATSATIEASLASGTNTQSQVVTRIRQLNSNVNDALMLENRILELLQRLGPVLKSMYRPEDDTTP